jgi:hypothetical protein
MEKNCSLLWYQDKTYITLQHVVCKIVNPCIRMQTIETSFADKTKCCYVL